MLTTLDRMANPLALGRRELSFVGANMQLDERGLDWDACIYLAVLWDGRGEW